MTTTAARTDTRDGQAEWTVVVADRVSLPGLGALLDDARFAVVQAAGWEPEDFEEALAGAAGLVVRSATRVDDALLAKAPRLKVVGRAGVGVDNIDLEAATARGVAVLNAPAGNTVSAAELTLALVLSTLRRIAAADASVRAGEWSRGRFAGVELRGKTLGLVGAGRIGGEVARRARAFGAKVTAYDPWLSDDRAEEIGVTRVELDALVASADIVSLHVPLTETTRGMIGAEQIRSMKSGAFLINVARGGIVDEDALAAALADGHLGGAALDVYTGEPLSAGSPLREAPNLVLTPHLGASTAEAQERVAGEIAEAVRAALVDGDLSRALNAPAIGGEALRRLRPVLDLGRLVGVLAGRIATGPVRRVEVRYAGAHEDVLRPLASYVTMGLVGVAVGEDRVNFVNAVHLAESRGIEISRQHLVRRSDYTEFVEARVRTEEGTSSVAGALLGDQHPRIVRIDDYHVDVTPRGSLIILRNRDVPGVIGRVGTRLGEAGLNIAEYHQARRSQGGEALAAIAVDGEVDRELLESLRGVPEVTDARLVVLR